MENKEIEANLSKIPIKDTNKDGQNMEDEDVQYEDEDGQYEDEDGQYEDEDDQYEDANKKEHRITIHDPDRNNTSLASKSKNFCIDLLKRTFCFVITLPFTILKTFGIQIVSMILGINILICIVLYILGISIPGFYKASWSIIAGSISFFTFMFSGCKGSINCGSCGSTEPSSFMAVVRYLNIMSTPVHTTAAAYVGTAGAITGALVSSSMSFSVLTGIISFGIVGCMIGAFLIPCVCKCGKCNKNETCNGVVMDLKQLCQYIMNILSIMLSIIFYYELVNAMIEYKKADIIPFENATLLNTTDLT